jgi:hypothetical protein
MKYLDEEDDDAARLGAVNKIINNDGWLLGIKFQTLSVRRYELVLHS